MKPMLIIQVPQWVIAHECGVNYLCELQPAERYERIKAALEFYCESARVAAKGEVNPFVCMSDSGQWKFDLMSIESPETIKAEACTLAEITERLTKILNDKNEAR